jgi:stearoyl-CoA desaturase (delta-9 desaturase)
MAKLPESIFLFLATLTIQGSALSWSHDHRLHHRYTDKEGDPYNVKKGLLHAHILWLFEKRPKIDQKIVPDLMENRLVVFQNRYFVILAVLANILVIVTTSWMLGDLLGAFVMVFGVRLFFSYHITWFINSLAHYWGEQSYSRECSARNNAILAGITLGEGYHSYHHAFPADYRNGWRWYQFDPNKWIIWLMSKVGLAKDLKKHNNHTITNRLIGLDHQRLLGLIQNLDKAKIQAALQKHGLFPNHNIEDLINSYYQSLRTLSKELSTTIKEYRATPKHNKPARQSLGQQLKELRRAYHEKWQKWLVLCKVIST